MTYGIRKKPSLEQLERRLFKKSAAIMRKAIKTTINRGTTKLRQTMQSKFREQINVSAAKMKSRLRVKKDLKNLRASVGVTNQGFDFLRFVKGRKEPRKQKGVKVSNRKPLKYEIKRGVQRSSPTLFLARTKSGNVRVFRRQDPTTKRKNGSALPLQRQTVPSPAYLLLKSTPTKAQIIRDITNKLRKDLATNAKFFAGKL